MLKVFADKFADAEILPLVKDDVENLKKTIRLAIKNFDVLITTGGVSVGDYDFTKPVLSEFGAEIFFEKTLAQTGQTDRFCTKK